MESYSDLITIGAVAVFAVVFYFFCTRLMQGARPYLPLPEPLPGMSLATRRVSPPDSASLALKIPKFNLYGRGLLAYMTLLPGVRVVSARGSTHDGSYYLGHFIYKERLYAVEVGQLGSGLTLRGYPPDEPAFAEVERHVQTYFHGAALDTLGAQWRICFLPSSPPPDKYSADKVDPRKGDRPGP